LEEANKSFLEEELRKLKEEHSASVSASQPTNAWAKKLYSTADKPDENTCYVVNAAKIELKESEKRAKNVLIFGIPRSSKHEAEERKEDDRAMVVGILNELGAAVKPSDIYRFNSSRSGVNDKPPPILVKFNTVEERTRTLKVAIKLRDLPNRNGVFINADMTPGERDYHKKLVEKKKELEAMLAGEEKRMYSYVIRDGQVCKRRRPDAN
jgi:predicted transcriptional regulator